MLDWMVFVSFVHLRPRSTRVRNRTSSVMDSITEWEDIPGIDKVIEHAKRIWAFEIFWFVFLSSYSLANRT